jgi:hypothetical protein
MSIKNENLNESENSELHITDVSNSTLLNTETGIKFILPLEMKW